MSDYTTWYLEPRDPLVFGDRTGLLPPQSTVAGMVRSHSMAGHVSREQALELLKVGIRGPWLAQKAGGGAPTLWCPLPADLVVVKEEDGGERFLPGALLRPAPEEGVSWPDGPDGPDGTERPELLVDLPARDAGGVKTSHPAFPFRPLEEVVAWTLGSRRDFRQVTEPPVATETRIHVGLDDETGAAAPEILFTSSGLGFARGFGLAVEVADDRSAPAEDVPDALVVLGGEARTARRRAHRGPCFPDFAAFEPCYRRRLAELEARGGPLGLRLQLLTPGDFGGWRPPLPEELEGKLRAACLGRYQAVSGWNLQKGGPRPARRLVPPGAVYFFGPFDSGEEVLGLCRRLWGRSLCDEAPGHEGSFLAAPWRDGYGFVLPAPCSLSVEDVKEES